MRYVAAGVGGFLGLVLGYFIGAYVACDWLYPSSNLCGIYGVVAAPIGFLIGSTVGWILSKARAT